MIRKFIKDGYWPETVEEFDIVEDLTTGCPYPIWGEGYYITEDYGDGRVHIEEYTEEYEGGDWGDYGIYKEVLEEQDDV